MKRFSSYYLGTMLIAGLAFSACTSDEAVNENALIIDKTFHVSIDASFAKADSRALTIEDDYISAIFEKGEKVYAYKKGTSDNSPTIGTLEAKSSGKSTTFEGNLTGDFKVGDEIFLSYQYSYTFNYTNQIYLHYSGQNGTWDDLKNYDFAYAWVTVEIVDDIGNIVTSKADFENVQSIFKFNVVDSDNQPVKLKNIKFDSDYFIISLAPMWPDIPVSKGVIPIFPETSIDEVWMAVAIDEGISSGNINITSAEDDEGWVYTGSKTISQKLENGHFYSSVISVSKTGKQNTLKIVPEDHRVLNGTSYYINKNTEKVTVSGNAEDYGIRIDVDNVEISLQDVNLSINGWGFDTNRKNNVVINIEGENILDCVLAIMDVEGSSVTFKGSGSLTFKWDISTPLEDYSEDHVKYEDGLTLTKNTDGTYTIKKAE